MEKNDFVFEPPEVTVVSISVRYQKAAEESTAEKKKVSISVGSNLSETILNQSHTLTYITLMSFSLAD